VRLTNWRGAPTNTPVPTGVYDPDRGRWEHLTQALWNGSVFVFSTTHFSEYDCNRPRGGGGGAGPGDGPQPGGPPCGDLSPASTCSLSGGSIGQVFPLPTHRVKDEDFGIRLSYQSGLAGGRRLGVGPSDYGAVNHSSFAVAVRGTRWEMLSLPSGAALDTAAPAQPGRCVATGGTTTFGQTPAIPLTLTRSLAGATTTETFSMGPLNKEAEFSAYVNLPMLSATSSSGSGL